MQITSLFPRARATAARDTGSAAAAEAIAAPSGRVEAVTVPLYSHTSREWSIYWTASPGSGRFDMPMVGHFDGPGGEFYSQAL